MSLVRQKINEIKNVRITDSYVAKVFLEEELST